MSEVSIRCERDVPAYDLPPLLTHQDGHPVTTAEQWWRTRRPELLDLFATHVYGHTPSGLHMRFIERRVDSDALAGWATRLQVDGQVLGADGALGPTMHILGYVPNRRRGPAPVIVGLNFHGNQTVDPDPGIALPTGWMPDQLPWGLEGHRATEASRGVAAPQWPVYRILERGYALLTAYCGDLRPDTADPQAYRAGVQAMATPTRRPVAATSSTTSETAEWGALGAWAWGLSRLLDYAVQNGDFDAKRCAVVGHSRLGKAALWAAAQDQRFGMVLANESGCGGAALSRRQFGETVAAITERFPHWFTPRFATYGNAEDTLPVDQHQLLALIAPRGLAVGSAAEDWWADPRGEYQAVVHASPAYELLDVPGLARPAGCAPPQVGEPITGLVGYHLRPGPHDITAYDWQRYLDAADATLATAD